MFSLLRNFLKLSVTDCPEAQVTSHWDQKQIEGDKTGDKTNTIEKGRGTEDMERGERENQKMECVGRSHMETYAVI